MLWIWLMALITIFLLGWFAYKLFSGGTPKLVVSGGHHDHSDDGSDDGSGHGSGHGHGGADGSADSESSGITSSGGSAGSSGSVGASAASGSAGASAVGGSASASASGGSASATSSGGSSGSSAGAGAAIAAAGAAAVAGTAAAGAMGSSRSGNQPRPPGAANPIVYENVTSGADIANAGNGATGHASGVTSAVSSDDVSSVREMIKILNLRDSDASRLGIDKSQFESLWQGNTESIDASMLSSVSSRLMNMMS